MQSASVLPPPPGWLGADWLGLVEDVPGDNARLLEVVEPPLENCDGCCGDSGAMAGLCGAGAPMAGAGLWDGKAGGAEGAVVVLGDGSVGDAVERAAPGDALPLAWASA